MSTPLRILITNDDGIDAPGIRILHEIALRISSEVWLVAPDGNQSGAGHRISFGRELRIDERGPRQFAIHGGSPADCVIAGATKLMGGAPPDVVLSGINNGQNLGDIINCSGTAAGAREGALQGALGIALSQGVNYEQSREVVWDAAVAHGEAAIRAIIATAAARPGLSAQAYFNVNFPPCAPDKVQGMRLVPAQRFARSPMRYYQSDNPGHFFVAIPETPKPLDPASDFEMLHKGRAVTVTPVLLQVTDFGLVSALDGALGAL
ncbi:5'-nucleotidase /3'-nucleotidase /exopolyphosphatase [Devosia enhydra]|uniref:5'-nucleotidase SurE n=1 Tax=Devosia enhydra TaxID=665118 RepID=A0A1K2HUY6_9HYPH|nr:5'/3'-nucleotidase SurE [Devosia enhydra]SFZ82360.1 5'-nucleotidase /3'-nucleotidase /exopolyphosphatase [Devosia enhydra]